MKKRISLKVSMMLIILIGLLLPATVSATAKTSYLQNTKKVYVYRVDQDNKKTVTMTYTGKAKQKELKGYNVWNVEYKLGADGNGKGGYWEKETTKGLYNTDGLVVSYPVKKNKKWKNDWSSLTIRSTNKTIKVPAGTFKNVIEVKVDDGEEVYYRYYAKNVGFVLGVMDGERSTELLKLKNKK